MQIKFSILHTQHNDWGKNCIQNITFLQRSYCSKSLTFDTSSHASIPAYGLLQNQILVAF